MTFYLHGGKCIAAYLGIMMLGLLGQPAVAEQSWPIPHGPSHEPAPYRYEDHRNDPVPGEFIEDVGACYLYAGSTYLIEPDGTVEIIIHEVVRLNGRKSAAELAEFTAITFDPLFEKATLNAACIHKRDGKKVEIRPRDVHLRDLASDYQSYDPEKQLIITFPGVQVGDVLEVKWTVRGKHPEYRGGYFNRYSFGAVDYPIVLDELRVRMPGEKKLRWVSSGADLAPTITEEKGAHLYRWSMSNTRWLPKDENAPSREELRPHVAFSTYQTWEEVGRWKHESRLECWECKPEVRRLVKEVTGGLDDPIAKARALTYWVKKNIRYVAIGQKHYFTPHHPETVLLNRYGDCKDTSQLLAVMLQEAGLHVELATLGTWGDGQVDENLPSPWGSHGILLVTIGKARHWVDTTASLSPWDFLPRDDRGRLCYLVDSRGNIRLERTPSLTPAENSLEQTTEIEIASDGSSHSTTRITATGLTAINYRDDFLETPSGERKRIVTDDLQDNHSRTRLLSLEMNEENLADLDQPVRFQTGYKIEDHFTGKPREAALSDNEVWSKFLAWNIAYDRKTPFQFYAPFELSHKFLVRLPACYQLESIPRNATVKSRWGSFARTIRPVGSDRRGLEIAFHTVVGNTRVNPSDFDEFRSFQRQMKQNYSVWLTLKPVGDLAEEKKLHARFLKAPEDSANAAILADLLYDHDQHDRAREVIAKALRASPKDPALLERAVWMSKTLEEEEAAQRKLVRLEPDNPSRKIDLAAVLVSRSKHEDARKVLEPILAKESPRHRAHAHYQLARSAYRRDHLKDALNHLDEAERIDADAVDMLRFHILRGQTTEELGQSADAIIAYERALTNREDATFALNKLVLLNLDADRREDALRYLRRYVLAVGGDPDGMIQAAEYYLRLGHDESAHDLASRVLREREDRKAHRILGMLYLARVHYVKAVEHLEQADLNSTALEGLFRALLRLGKLDQCVDRLDEVERVRGVDFALNSTVGDVNRLVKQRETLLSLFTWKEEHKSSWKKAAGIIVCAEEMRRLSYPPSMIRSLVDEALKEVPDFPPALAWAGRIALEQGKLRDARRLADRTLELAPKYYLALYLRGRACLEQGRGVALTDLEKADQLAPSPDAHVKHALADALAQAGRVADALKVQEAAVRLLPQNKEMQEQLGRIRGMLNSEKNRPVE